MIYNATLRFALIVVCTIAQLYITTPPACLWQSTSPDKWRLLEQLKTNKSKGSIWEGAVERSETEGERFIHAMGYCGYFILLVCNSLRNWWYTRVPRDDIQWLKPLMIYNATLRCALIVVCLTATLYYYPSGLPAAIHLPWQWEAFGTSKHKLFFHPSFRAILYDTQKATEKIGGLITLYSPRTALQSITIDAKRCDKACKSVARKANCEGAYRTVSNRVIMPFATRSCKNLARCDKACNYFPQNVRNLARQGA